MIQVTSLSSAIVSRRSSGDTPRQLMRSSCRSAFRLPVSPFRHSSAFPRMARLACLSANSGSLT